MIYQLFVKPFLFLLEPERAHRTVFELLKICQVFKPLRKTLARQFTYEHPSLRQTLFGCEFPNPLGLAAGFDKNCEIYDVLPCFGFGFTECGTVTAQDQSGNAGPRIFRLEEAQALINRMGFNNHGALWVQKCLIRRGRSSIPFGINIGKSKVTELERALEDYLFTFENLYAFGDYFAINVSSPNTPRLRELQKNLDPLLAGLQEKNRKLARQAEKNPKPLFVKISPDLTLDEADEIAAACLRHEVAGLIATNTTTARDALRLETPIEGGLSGKPLEEMATQILRHLYPTFGKKMVLIGVGGIFTADDAYRKIRAGASLLQIYTGWVYGGPSTISRINRGLAQFLARDGFTNISQAVGTGIR